MADGTDHPPENITPQALSAYVPISTEMLAVAEETAVAWDQYMNASPEERARWAEEARQKRSDERVRAVPQSLTLERVLDKLGWSEDYARHFVQDYCDCSDGMDGWYYCQHASDEGLVR